jgi:hypothetical protein
MEGGNDEYFSAVVSLNSPVRLRGNNLHYGYKTLNNHILDGLASTLDV